MGEQGVATVHDERQTLAFTQALLHDLRALELLIEAGRLDAGPRHLGAEQEMFLVSSSGLPVPCAPALLAAAPDARLTSEIGRFNLEANLTPRLYGPGCLLALEQEIHEVLDAAARAAAPFGARPVLAGILPTLRRSDLGLANMFPGPRYAELNHVALHLRGGAFHVHLDGPDPLVLTHDNVMLEACCTSFQAHLQVTPAEFATLYNHAQAITAPVLAAAANSPVWLGHRLWDETRIALFQCSVDERDAVRQQREHPPRVSFGDRWIDDSVLEIFREQVLRFRHIFTRAVEEDSLAVLQRGELPALTALKLHNGSVWRWNRACCGITDGQPHLRIELRALPAGPTVADEMANLAFFLGLLEALPKDSGRRYPAMSFAACQENFFAAARHGLYAMLEWPGSGRLMASELIQRILLPLAAQGLRDGGLADGAVYLDILRERVRSRRNGAFWARASYESMEGRPEQKDQALVLGMLAGQAGGRPVHEWPLAPGLPAGAATVASLMSRDLFTVRPDDLLDLAANVMDWRHVRHVPVEDDSGRLAGILSHRDLLQHLATGMDEPVPVRALMRTELYTCAPETPARDALALLRRHHIGCLPVVDGERRLVGLVTESDFLRLLELP